MKDNLIILYSGGADSRLMLELALREGRQPFCILIDYGQLHYEELEFAQVQLTKLKISYQLVQLHNLQINSGLTGSGQKNTSGVVHEMHVPSRNLMFVGIAASIAESKAINTIWYGADYSDLINNKFPDCIPIWIRAINEVLSINGPTPIKLEAPLIYMTKEEIIKKLEGYGIKKIEIFSGYGDL